MGRRISIVTEDHDGHAEERRSRVFMSYLERARESRRVRGSIGEMRRAKKSENDRFRNGGRGARVLAKPKRDENVARIVVDASNDRAGPTHSADIGKFRRRRRRRRNEIERECHRRRSRPAGAAASFATANDATADDLAGNVVGRSRSGRHSLDGHDAVHVVEKGDDDAFRFVDPRYETARDATDEIRFVVRDDRVLLTDDALVEKLSREVQLASLRVHGESAKRDRARIFVVVSTGTTPRGKGPRARGVRVGEMHGRDDSHEARTETNKNVALAKDALDGSANDGAHANVRETIHRMGHERRS